MDFDATWKKYWKMLYLELEQSNGGSANAPLLTHYTSLSNLENILQKEQVWLSNPLFMNDLEEVRFGVNHGIDLTYTNEALRKALVTDTRTNLFYDAIDQSYDQYGNEQVLDLYVMCFSEHDPHDQDGRLSMWRGYGANGKGAAIVFDVSDLKETDSSPLALAPVHYASQQQRKSELQGKIEGVADFIHKNDIPDEHIGNLARELFNRIALYAVFSKHDGFDEEREWRLVYFKDRDTTNALAPYLSYFNGPDGLQPKLKLDLKPIEGVLSEDIGLAKIIDRIIIGPSASSPLAKMTAERMLRALGRGDLIHRLVMSSIPYRDS